jgi:glutamine synthetase
VEHTADMDAQGGTPPTIEQVEELFVQHQIDSVKLGGVDIDGLWRGKRIPARHFLERVALHGTHLSNIVFGWDLQDVFIPGLDYTGWNTGYRDLLLKPDLTTLAVVPWEPGMASVMCDFEEPNGSPVPFAPRHVLGRIVERLRERGLEPMIGYEFEFTLFRETPHTIHEKHYQELEPFLPGNHTYNLHRGALSESIIGDIRRHMENYGIALEGTFHEWGPSQIEINLHYDQALRAADHAVLYKEGVKEIAGLHGLLASFMAKPFWEWPGNSGHVHQSLRNEDGENAFHSGTNDQTPAALSHLARHYIGGVLTVLKEFTVLCCPFVNSYKRKTDESFASTTSTWGIDNRTAGLRVIVDDPSACRIECRLPGSDANPYLSIAACLAGGLYGIENEIEPAEPIQDNIYALDVEKLGLLPRSLGEAIAALENSQLARSLLGDGFVEHYLATRRWEAACADQTVTDWERARYLEMA